MAMLHVSTAARFPPLARPTSFLACNSQKTLEGVATPSAFAALDPDREPGSGVFGGDLKVVIAPSRLSENANFPSENTNAGFLKFGVPQHHNGKIAGEASRSEGTVRPCVPSQLRCHIINFST